MEIIRDKPHWFKIKAKGGRVIPFKENKVQKYVQKVVDEQIEQKGRARIIIIKGRQQGISTKFLLEGLDGALSQPAFTGYCMAHDATTASDLFDKVIKFAWDNLGPALKDLYKPKRDNVRQLMFEGVMNSSSFTVGTSGRGSTIDFLLISEAGKMSERKNVWKEMTTGTLQAAEQAKHIIIESTANGGLGVFYEMVQESLNGQNEYKTIFLSWTDTKEYQTELPEDEQWKDEYRLLAKQYNLYENPVEQFGITQKQWYWYYNQSRILKEEVKVEYPFTIEEAFISKAYNKFDINTLKNIKAKEPLQIIDGVKIFKMPEESQIYSMGIDPSSGLGSDWSCLSVRNFYTGELVAQLKGKVREREMARIAVNLANWYNQKGKTYIACEVNGLGRAVQNMIQDTYDEDLIYKRYVQDPTKQRDSMIPDLGFQTTNKNRDLIINNFVYAFVDKKVDIVNEDEIREAKAFIFSLDKNRYEAQEGSNDDLLFSDFICYENFNYIRQHG
jgi:hypothetical protein